MGTKQNTITTFRDGQQVGEPELVTYTTTTQQDNEETIRNAAQQALSTNRTFLNNTTPTAAQNAAQIRALTRQNNGIIRLMLGQLDETD